MDKTNKEQVVAELTEKMGAAKVAFLTDYRGIDVEAANALRGELHKANVEYRVVKNTFLKIAIKGTDKECLNEYLNGPTSLTIAKEDPVAPAKALSDFAKANKNFELKCGIMDGKLLTVADITALADLPSREVLLAKVLGSISAPATNFVGVLAAMPRSLVQVLGAIKDQKEAA